jgi:hypothetical protein
MNTRTPVEQDPAQLRQRAEDARREAERTTDPITRETLIAIAVEYEKLAACAEAKIQEGQ